MIGVDLQYSQEDFQSYITAITEEIRNMNLYKEDLAVISGKENVTKLDGIRADWTTPGGSSFFSRVDEDWATGMDACIAMLEELKDMIETAKTAYTELETQALSILKVPEV